MYLATQSVRAFVLFAGLLVLIPAYGQSLPVIHILAAPGTYVLAPAQSVTAASLPGVTLDYNPPQLGTVPAYPVDQQDGVSPAPYISPNLRNFRFTDFDNLFSFGGDHTWPLADYAAVHGFNSIAPAGRDAALAPWIPAGTGWGTALDLPSWSGIMGTLGLAADRYDQVVDVGEPAILQALTNANYFGWLDPSTVTEVMLDMEHQPLDPTTLRQQSWYPAGASAANEAAFEKKYYDGFAMTLYATADYYRQRGFSKVSIYGWQPARVGINGLATFNANPQTDWYWQNVGIQVIGHVDSVNFRSYFDYWTPDNVAYSLAMSDIAVKYVRSLPTAQQKPVRGYFSTQIIGGGGGWRWFAGMPAPTEELRAAALLNAFTQYNGMVDYDFTGYTNFNFPRPVVTGTDVMLKDNSFTAVQEGGGTRTFARYNALHITNVDASGNVRFQLIDRTGYGTNYGVLPSFPFYDSTVSDITAHLRARTEPISGLFEGLALAKEVESILRYGSRVVDFDSQQTFARSLPILRHVVKGGTHLIATYDPQVIYGLPARTITVNNFNGISGLTVTFPADSQVRLFMLKPSAH